MKVKVFSAFLGWTLPSQYRFGNLERPFFIAFQKSILMVQDFDSFTYSAHSFPNGKYFR